MHIKVVLPLEVVGTKLAEMSLVPGDNVRDADSVETGEESQGGEDDGAHDSLNLVEGALFGGRCGGLSGLCVLGLNDIVMGGGQSVGLLLCKPRSVPQLVATSIDSSRGSHCVIYWRWKRSKEVTSSKHVAFSNVPKASQSLLVTRRCMRCCWICLHMHLVRAAKCPVCLE